MTAHWYKARLVKGGPYVAVKAWHGAPVVDDEEQDRSHRWQCLVGNEKTGRAILMGDATPVEVDGILLRNLEAITEPEYLFLRDTQAHAERYDKGAPAASPTKAIDWSKRKPIF